MDNLEIKKKKKKERLDSLMFKRGLAASREKAKALIMAGEVLVDGHAAAKAGTPVSEDACIEIKEKLFPYVSRGGNKLACALDSFDWDVSGLLALDIGASTGGFTDCLLTRGVRKVFCVDVGYGQLDFKLRNDPRIVNMEKTNFRHIEKSLIPEPVDIVVIDVSFISLSLIIPRLKEFLQSDGRVVCLVKPQFELERKDIGKGGIVRDSAKWKIALDRVAKSAEAEKFTIVSTVPSPILGAKGNKEFLMGLKNMCSSEDS